MGGVIVTNNIVLEYEGELTQEIISKNMTIIEDKIEHMGLMGKVATVSVELSQNMMTYSKSKYPSCHKVVPSGLLEISSNDLVYTIKSTNIIGLLDKEKIEPKLKEIQSLDASGIKKRYKELRKSAENAHDNNAGIGFFEIAKQITSLEFEFIEINDEKFYFSLRVTVEPKKK